MAEIYDPQDLDNFLTLNRESLLSLQDWLMQYHAYWGSSEETLENYAKYLGR